jgi:hypothetical protein
MHLDPDKALPTKSFSAMVPARILPAMFFMSYTANVQSSDSDDTVIKCGYGVTQEEFLNNLVGQTVIRVHQVQRFFAHMEIGYIIMDFIDGETLTST